MSRKWVLLILFLLAGVFLYSGSQGNFEARAAQLQTIERAEGVGGGLLVPGEVDSLNRLEQDLSEFRDSIGPTIPLFGSPDTEALRLLVDRRLHLVAMERSLLASRQKTAEPGFPDCRPGGNVDIALQLLEEASSRALEAGGAQSQLRESFPSQYRLIQEDQTLFERGVEEQLESIHRIESLIQNRCT